MTDKEIPRTGRNLSLDEMLKLANQIDSWEHFPQRDSLLSFTPEQYVGMIDGIVIRIAEYGATPWGGWKRVITAEYGNLELGCYPKGLGFDNRLDSLFYHSIPKKIRRQGLAILEKISKEIREIEARRTNETFISSNI